MKKIIRLLFILVIVFGGFFGYRWYSRNFKTNVVKEGYVLIPHGASFSQVLDSIQPFLSHPSAFKEIALKKQLDKHIRAGRYHIQLGDNNPTIINRIKSGSQSANTFRIGDFSNVYQMIGKVSLKTELDSLQFIHGLDKIAQNKGYRTAEDLKKYFFIDTYDFYWTVTPEEFFNKFENQYNNFWDHERTLKEKLSGLTRDQIYALASIVFKESGGKRDEQKTIAGLYLNRYRQGIKLQSDPTVIYAINQNYQFKTKIKRVLYKDLKINSPYNTYFNKGIPPGPICIVDKNAVDAVLNAEKNNYLFMSADPLRSGYHKFTNNASEHMINAKAYQEWLNAKNIKR